MKIPVLVVKGSKRFGFAIQKYSIDIIPENCTCVSSSNPNHEYECNEIDDAFLLQAEIGIVYSPVLDDSPLFYHPLSSTPALALALRP